MFSLFRKSKPEKIKSPVFFQHSVLGPAAFHPTTKQVESWGNLFIPSAILYWAATTINMKDFRVGRTKFIDGTYKFVYHFKNKADAVAFKLEFS